MIYVKRSIGPLFCPYCNDITMHDLELKDRWYVPYVIDFFVLSHKVICRNCGNKHKPDKTEKTRIKLFSRNRLLNTDNLWKFEDDLKSIVISNEVVQNGAVDEDKLQTALAEVKDKYQKSQGFDDDFYYNYLLITATLVIMERRLS